jgi:hypothetical protein
VIVMGAAQTESNFKWYGNGGHRIGTVALGLA